jgi:hypothetical protein
MQQGFTSEHRRDDNGNPAGGRSRSNGIDIRWQDGPLGRGAGRVEPNGAFVEDVIGVVLDRLRFYQGEDKYAEGEGEGAGRFRCRENAIAITKLEEALHWLQHRTAARETREVEGTHAV